MAYRVINDFIEEEDNNNLYKSGKEFPRGSYKPSKERIEFLSKLHPKYNLIFIEKIEEPKKAATKKAPAKTKKATDDKNDKS